VAPLKATMIVEHRIAIEPVRRPEAIESPLPFWLATCSYAERDPPSSPIIDIHDLTDRHVRALD
jgi:hypothetical protein